MFIEKIKKLNNKKNLQIRNKIKFPGVLLFSLLAISIACGCFKIF